MLVTTYQTTSCQNHEDHNPDLQSYFVLYAQTRTELGWSGHGDVIYKALEPLLYQREAAIIQPLVSCLITVLGKVEGGYIKDEANYKVKEKAYAQCLSLCD
jgi:hypothetical protein